MITFKLFGLECVYWLLEIIFRQLQLDVQIYNRNNVQQLHRNWGKIMWQQSRKSVGIKSFESELKYDQRFHWIHNCSLILKPMDHVKTIYNIENTVILKVSNSIKQALEVYRVEKFVYSPTFWFRRWQNLIRQVVLFMIEHFLEIRKAPAAAGIGC